MSLVIRAREKKTRVKIYRWLQRHKAFYWVVDGKGYSTISKKVIKTQEQYKRNKPTLHSGLSFAECDGNSFEIDYFKLLEMKEIAKEFYEYISTMIKNEEISIYLKSVKNLEYFDFIFGKKEINPDCEECNIFKLFQLKHQENIKHSK
jgi:hypothetical protein